MEKELKIKISVDKKTGAIKVAGEELKELSNSTQTASRKIDGFNKSLTNMAKAAVSIYTVKEALEAVIGTGFKYNSSMEQSIAGISALNVATSLNVSAMGEALSVSKKYQLAQDEAVTTAMALAKINAETPHSLNETNQIYKAMYVSMKNAGASSSEMINLTKKISIAAGSAGIEFNSLLAGVDGLATGTVLANSDLGRFLSGLGLTNEALKETDDVVKLLENRLAEFKAADTMGVAVSNLRNEWEQLTGVLSEDIFSMTKNSIKESSTFLSYFKDEVHEILVQYKELEDIKSLDDINIKLIQLYRDLATEQNKSTTFMWNSDKKVRRARIESIKEEIDLLKKRKAEAEKPDKLVAKSAFENTDYSSVFESSLSAYDKAIEKINKKLPKGVGEVYGAEEDSHIKRYEKYQAAQLKLSVQENDARNAATQALENYNKSLQNTYNKYISITGSNYDKWLMNTNATMIELASTGALTATELQNAYDVMEQEYNKEQKGKELDLSIKGLDDSMNSMTSLLDSQIALAESGMSWGNSLDGVAKSVANVSKAFTKIDVGNMKFEKADLKLQQDYAKEFLKADGDIGKQKELSVKFDEDQAKLKTARNEAELAGYASLAGAMSSAYEKGSAGAIAFAAVQSALGIASSWTAIANAWAQPFPANIAAAAMVASQVMPIIQQLGGSGGGSGGTASPYSAAELAGAKVTELEDNRMVSELEQQTELLEAIEKNGSAQALSVQLAQAEFTQSKNSWVQDVYDNARMGFVDSKFTNPTQDFANIQSYYDNKGLVNPYEMQGSQIKINSSYFRENPDDLIAVLADMTKMTQGDGFDYTGPFGQDLASELGWGEEAHQAFLASVKSSFTEIQEYLNDWAISVVESVSELRDSAGDMKEYYDSITGTTYYANKALENAFKDFDKLLGKGESYADYLVKNIDSIETTTKYIDKMSGVLDENGKELSNYELLLSKNTDLIDEQMAKVEEFGSEVGKVFSNGAEEALNYIDSIEAVTEALAADRENTNSFINSFKNEQQLAEDLATANGVSLATNMEELSSLFVQLKSDTFGLTDAELELLEANKELIDSDLDEYIEGITSNVSTLENALGSLENIIEKLKNSALGSTYTMDNFYASMSETLELSKTDNYAGFEESLNKTISYSDALFEASNFSSNADMQFAQLVAASQFEAMEVTTLEQIDYLKLIEENTAKSNDLLAQQLANLSNSINNLDNSLEESTSSSLTAVNNTTFVTDNGAFLENSTDSLVNSYYKDLLGRSAEQGGLDNWTNQIEAGIMTPAQVQSAIMQSQEYKTLNGFSNGGYTGDEEGIVHPKEYVLNAETSSQLGLNDSSSTGVFGQLVKEIKGLKEEVAALRAENSTLQQQIVDNTQRSRIA